MGNMDTYHCGRLCGRIVFLLAALLGLVLLGAGCSRFEKSDEGEVLTYDVCDDSMLPEELMIVIDKKKEKAFNLVYSNSTYTYIVLAAGMQNRDDVELVVDEMYKDENAVYVKGVLRQVSTPTDGVDGDNVSYPYTVIRIMKMDLPVVFK